MTARPVALTDRDRAIIRAAWSLGAATAATLRALTSPATSPGTFRERLRRLHRGRYLTQTRYVAPAGSLWLYGAGLHGVPPGAGRPWRPGLAQVAHTLDVGHALVALTRPGFAPPLRVTAWQGEAELRAWAAPGAPFPDARVSWRAPDTAGSWLVEVDRATESRAAFRRKLVRYLTGGASSPVLVLTTSGERARRLAVVAADVGVPLLATTLAQVQQHADPIVTDSRTRTRRALTDASLHPEAVEASLPRRR